MVRHPYTMKDAKAWINHCQEAVKKRPRTNYNFAIELKSPQTLMGGIGLDHIDRYSGTAEMGYYLGEDFHRQGYMSEAAAAVIDFAFNRLKLRRLEAFVFKGNEGSQGLAKKLGFKQEGIMKQAVRAKSTDEIHDKVIYGLLKENWK